MATSIILRKSRAAQMFGGAAFTPPSTYYLALLKDTGNYPNYTPTEITGTGYARIAIPNDAEHWTAPNQEARVFNKKRHKFAKIVTEDWPQIQGVALYDAAQGGTPLYSSYAYLSTPLIEDTQIVFLENTFSYYES